MWKSDIAVEGYGVAPDLNSDHPWHPSQVTPEKLQDLRDRIHLLIGEMWKTDEDGDLPVQIMLIDRTRCSAMWGYRPVPYEHRADTHEELQRIHDALVGNLETAVGALSRFQCIRKTAFDQDRAFERKVREIFGDGLSEGGLLRAIKKLKEAKDESPKQE